MSSRERWGYVLWGSVAVVVAIPEVAALWHRATWPTISGTVGHLEEVWPPSAVLVVVAIVVLAVQAAKAMRSGGVRTVRGAAVAPAPPASRRAEIVYGVLAFLAVVVPAIAALALRGDISRQTKWILGYVVYGLVGVVCVGVPSALAYWGGRDVPFPGLFRTLANLEARWHWAAVVVLAGLVVLLIHLALYPWPDVPHHNPTPSSP